MRFKGSTKTFSPWHRLANVLNAEDMAGRVIIFLQRDTYEPAFQATSIGVTAAAMGDEVYFVVAFDALRGLARGAFGKPRTERETAESTRGTGLGVPMPSKLLEEARGLGAKVLACDTTVRLCGLSEQELAKSVDEILGLPQIWKLTEGARLLSF